MEPCSRRVWVDVLFRFALFAVAVIVGSTVAFAQFQGNNGDGNGGSATGNHSLDPGVRGGSPGAGGPLGGMNTDYQNFFAAALARFQETDSVSGKITNENGTIRRSRWQLRTARPTKSPVSSPQTARFAKLASPVIPVGL